MMFVAVSLFVYGLLMLAGGVAGYAKAQSIPSLVSGLAAAGLAALAGALALRGLRAGVMLGLALCLVLAAFGGKSYVIDHKAFMPRGLIFVLSLAELLLLAVSVRR